MKKKNKTKKSRYELVTVRSFNGIEDGSYSWTFLTYAVMERKLDDQIVCMRDNSKTYQYISDEEDRNKIGIGEVRVFPAHDYEFDTMRIRCRHTINKYINNSELYFADDTKYAKEIENEEKGYVKVK